MSALFAPWVLHTGMGPDDAMSALMTKVIMFTLEAAGIPFVVGGSSRIVDAFRTLIESNGSAIETGADVTGVVVENGKAVGVETAAGRRVAARRAVGFTGEKAMEISKKFDTNFPAAH